MINDPDLVGIVGMSPNGSTYMTVDSFDDADNKTVPLEPPIAVILEGEEARVAVVRGTLAARYTNEELHEIGEGNMFRGLDRVIGSVAVDGLAHGAIKPLHPNLFEGEEAQTALPAAQPALTS